MKKLNDITEELISYIIAKLSGKIIKTQLVKLIYLCDVEAYKFTGSQVTNIKWEYYHYGPYNKELDHKLQLLEKNKIIEKIPKSRITEKQEPYFIYKHKGIDINYDFSVMQKNIINTILKQYGSFTLNSLLELIYDVEPMKNTKQGKLIDFDKIRTIEKYKNENK